MGEEKFVKIRDWVEPAHPAVVKLRDDLVEIYKYIREKYQEGIDAAFDRVSRQIGFVVTTTLPVILEVGEGGVVKSITMGAEHLKGTLFDKELSGGLKSFAGSKIGTLATGTYKLNLIWFDALRLKLRTEWMEPAHFRTGGFAGGIRPEMAARFVGIKQCAWCEPAHWFDPGIAMAVEEAVMIEAIDEVYPELKLVDQIASSREAFLKVGPGVREPAHFRQIERGVQEEKTKGVLSELAAVLRRYGY
jgi:hypothetical protein